MIAAIRNTRAFGALLVQHVRLHWFAYVLLALCLALFRANYRLGINETPSLPQTFFLIHKRALVEKGDYVSFRVSPEQSGGIFNAKMILTKIVVGAPGDTVTVRDRLVSVNGVPVGVAKERSLKGEPLDPIQATTVPSGYWYVMGLHKDSLDSRYSIVGLVPASSVLGRAHPIF